MHLKRGKIVLVEAITLNLCRWRKWPRTLDTSGKEKGQDLSGPVSSVHLVLFAFCLNTNLSVRVLVIERITTR